MLRLCLVALVLVTLGLPARAQVGVPPDIAAAMARVRSHMDRGAWEAALPDAEAALGAAVDSLGEGHFVTVEVALTYALLLVNTERNAEALDFLEQLFASVKTNFTPWSPFYMQTEIRLADQLAYAGRGDEALPLAMGAARRMGETAGANDPMTARYLFDAAKVMRSLGHADEALVAFRRVLPVFDADPSPQSARAAAQVAFLIGDTEDLSGNAAAALHAYRDADRRMTAAFGPRHPETLSARVARARMAYVLEQRDELADLIAVTAPVAAAVFGPEGIEAASWLRLEARLMLITPGQGAEAGLPLMARAVAMIAAKLPETHRVLAEARHDYAGMLSFAGDFEAAWTQFAASQRVLAPDRKLMLDLLEFRREAGGVDEASFAVEALPHLQRAAHGAARAAVREQALRGLIRDTAVAALYREATDLVEQRNRIETALVEQASLPVGAADPAAEAGLRAQHADLTAAIASRLAEVRAREPAFAELSGEVELDLAAIQALLAPDEALVVIDHQRHDQEWSVAVAITSDAVLARVFWVPTADLRGWIDEIRASVRLTLGVRAAEALSTPVPPAPPGAFPFNAAHALYRQSLGVVEDALQGKRHIMVDLRGLMTGVPPALLLAAPPRPGMTVGSAPWLVRSHAVTVLPSITSLRTAALAADAPRAPEAFAGFADPVFDPAEAAMLLAEAGSDTRLRGALAPLPETAGEARAVRAAIAGDGGALWLGAEASEARLKRAGLGRYRMLYFATHGLVSGDRAGQALLGEPALALTPGEGEDGFLTATEVAALPLNADFVVLSACNTAEGGAPGAEPLSGLAQAFLYAGARSLLVSHWPVESRSAVRLMTDLFRIRAEAPTLRAAEAQRKAMLAMIEAPTDPRWSHPAYWAPFILVGSQD